jgi:hypothetical protein
MTYVHSSGFVTDALKIMKQYGQMTSFVPASILGGGGTSKCSRLATADRVTADDAPERGFRFLSGGVINEASVADRGTVRKELLKEVGGFCRLLRCVVLIE